MSPAYQWDAADYARHAGAQHSWAHELLSRLALAGHERVLDLGCGDGAISAAMADAVPAGHVLGIDSSPAMIARARSALGRPNLAFALVDATALPFSAEFDIAFSNATLHWIADQPAVLAGVARALVPGGRLLFQMGGQGNLDAFAPTLARVLADARWRDRFVGFGCPWHFHSPAEYAGWLHSVGLEPARVELLTREMAQAGAGGLAGWVRTTWLPYLERLTAAEREPFVAAVVADYLAEHPLDAAGVAHVPMRRLEVAARRP